MKKILAKIFLDVIFKSEVEEKIKRRVKEAELINTNKWRQRIKGTPDIHYIIKTQDSICAKSDNNMLYGSDRLPDETGFLGLPKWFPVMSRDRLIELQLQNKNVDPDSLVKIAEADRENYYYNVEEEILYGKVKVTEDYIKVLCEKKL